MDGTRDYHTKWSKSDRERQILYYIPYMWNLQNNTSEFIDKKNRLTDMENKLLVTKRLRWEGKTDKLGVWD